MTCEEIGDMASANIDTPFDSACYKRGSDQPSGSDSVLNTFPGLEPATNGQVDVVLIEYTGLEKPELPAFGRTLGGNK